MMDYENTEGVIVAGMLRLVCMRGTQHDSILLHLGVKAVKGGGGGRGSSQSSTGEIPPPTGQSWQHHAQLGVLEALTLSSSSGRKPAL